MVGDNGAGKSILLKIVAGVIKPASGKIYLDGREVRFKSAADAMSKGVAITYEFLEEQLVDIAKVWENFYMGREVTKRTGPIKLLNINIMRNLTRKIIDKYRLGFEETREIKDLSGGSGS